MTPRKLAKQVIKDLASVGAYLHHDAQTGSQYIKFKDSRMGSMRVADHKGKPKYSYRWNLWISNTRIKLQEYDGYTTRHHYSQHYFDEMVEAIKRFKKGVAFIPTYRSLGPPKPRLSRRRRGGGGFDNRGDEDMSYDHDYAWEWDIDDD